MKRRAAANTDHYTTPSGIVTEFLHALETQDHECIAELLHPDLRYTNVSLPTISGGERVAQLMRLALRRGTSFAVRIHNLAADGDTVMTERTDILKIGPAHIGFWVCGTFRVEDGRIVLWRDYFDWMDFSTGAVRGLAGIVVPGLRRQLSSQ